MQHIGVQAQLRARVGREDPVHALGAQFPDRRRGRLHGRAHPARLPGGVRPCLVQEVPAVLRPGPVRVLGQVQQRRLGGGHHDPALGAVLGEPVLVVRLQLRQMRAGEEGQAEPGGPAGGGLGGAADQEQRVRVGVRARGDADRAAPIGEGLARPRLQQRLQQLVLEPAAPGEVHAEQVVLLGPVSDPGDRHQPAAAQQVQHGDLLGQPQRVVQRADHRRDRDRDTPGRAENGPRERERGRQPVVVGAVVLLRLHGGDAPVVGVRGHLQGRPVTGAELGGGGPGSDEVEACDRDGHGDVSLHRAGVRGTLADDASDIQGCGDPAALGPGGRHKRGDPGAHG